MALSQGIIFGLLVMLLWGLAKVIIKPAINRIGPYYALLYEQVIVVISIITFSLFYAAPYVPSREILIMIAAIAVIGAIPIYFLFKAMSVGKVSLVAPIANSSSLLTVFLSYIFYREILSGRQLIAVFLLIIGVLLISFRYSEIRRLRLSRKIIPGAKFAFITMIGWGLYFFLIKPIIVELGPVLSAMYLETGILIVLSVIFFIDVFRSKSAAKPGKAFFYVFFGGITTAAGVLFFNMGVEKSGVSIMYPLASSSLLVTVLASVIFLKERIELNQKIAIFLILLGIILISL